MSQSEDKKMKTTFNLFIWLLLLSGCEDLVVKNQIVENYYLVASDDPTKTCLSYHELSEDNFGCIIDASVFAVGHNDNFMIIKQHPFTFSNPPNKSITNYYILPLLPGMNWRTKNGLVGPRSEAEFGMKRKELGLPDTLTFTKVLDNLE